MAHGSQALLYYLPVSTDGTLIPGHSAPVSERVFKHLCKSLFIWLSAKYLKCKYKNRQKGCFFITLLAIIKKYMLCWDEIKSMILLDLLCVVFVFFS